MNSFDYTCEGCGGDKCGVPYFDTDGLTLCPGCYISCFPEPKPRTTLGDRLAKVFLIAYALLVLAFVIAALLLTGCAIHPDEVHAKAPSWDGNTQNSGIIGPYDPARGMPETAHWLWRYNALIANYGAQFKPPVQTNAGITFGKDGTIYANHFARVKMYVMSQWNRSAMHQTAAPTPTLLQKAGL